MSHTVINITPKSKKALEMCWELRITEKPDFSVLDPYLSVWDGETREEFKRKMNEYQDEIAESRAELTGILQFLEDYIHRMKKLDSEGNIC